MAEFAMAVAQFRLVVASSIGKAGKNDTNVLNFANAIRQMYKL